MQSACKATDSRTNGHWAETEENVIVVVAFRKLKTSAKESTLELNLQCDVSHETGATAASFRLLSSVVALASGLVVAVVVVVVFAVVVVASV